VPTPKAPELALIRALASPTGEHRRVERAAELTPYLNLERTDLVDRQVVHPIAGGARFWTVVVLIRIGGRLEIAAEDEVGSVREHEVLAVAGVRAGVGAHALGRTRPAAPCSAFSPRALSASAS